MKAKPRITAPQLSELKSSGRKIVCLTCFDAPTAGIGFAAGADILLVGDTLGMVSLGMKDTLGVEMADMVRAVRASRRGAPGAFIVGDLPFMSFQVSIERTLRSAGALIRAGAQAVKLEGAGPHIPGVKRLVSEGIPVMGHVGLLPQSVHALGGYGRRGRSPGEAARILKDAKALQTAGVFALVLEHIPDALARRISASLKIPTIGIGAGPFCDGQVLVLYDLLGLTQKAPPFVKAYAQLGRLAAKAASRFAADVRGGLFPSPRPGRG